MDFFKSVFSDEPEPEPTSDLNSPTQTQLPEPQDRLTEEPPHNEIDSKDPIFTPTSSSASVWSFGGLIKTLASKSESVIQTYKKDLEEFSSELKKETDVIRQVASKAVKDLPGSLEVGASVAQESLESVGQAIDDLGSTVWRGTAGIITHGKDVLLNADQESEFLESQTSGSASMDVMRYSRFESQIRAIQTDLNTYVEEPEDLDEFDQWKSGFVLGDKDEEIDNLLSENGDMDSVYRKVVPKTVDDETFWSRYFYKVYKLKQVEEARANFVKRAIAGEDEEDLSWDVDDDEEEESNASMWRGNTSVDAELEKKANEGPLNEGPLVESSNVDVKVEEENANRDIDGNEVVSQSRSGDEVQAGLAEENSALSESDNQSMNEKSEEKLVLDGKTDQVDSCKDSDVSVVSTQPSLPEEQDLSWDEIEDLSGIDEKKASVSSDSPSKADLRKRLSAPDEEEDLSWDIEDDD